MKTNNTDNNRKDSTDNNRRDFLKKAGTVVGVGLFASSIGSIISSCEQDEVVSLPPPETYDINLSSYSTLGAVGGMALCKIVLTNGLDKTLAVWRKEESKFIVLDSLCRHQNCLVILPDSPGGELVCPCHMAKFSFEDGSVTHKPFSEEAPPLTEYEVYEFDKTNNVLKVIV